MRKTSELLWQDSQHQELFNILDQMNKFDDSIELFDRLMKHADAHFMLEEAYMENSEYPDIIEHKKEHAAFKQQLKEYIELNPVYDKDFRDEMYTFITDWLESHVFGIDKTLEKHILLSNMK